METATSRQDRREAITVARTKDIARVLDNIDLRLMRLAKQRLGYRTIRKSSISGDVTRQGNKNSPKISQATTLRRKTVIVTTNGELSTATTRTLGTRNRFCDVGK